MRTDYEIASTAQTLPEELSRLASHEDVLVHSAVAHNPGAPTGALLHLALDPEAFVRCEVARNRSATPDVMAVLGADPTPEVQKAIEAYAFLRREPPLEITPEDEELIARVMDNHPGVARAEVIAELWAAGGL